jgi:hypothetical protein
MSQAVGIKDSNRLPWLEPYRAPSRSRGLPAAPLAGLVVVAIDAASSIHFLRPVATEQAPAPRVQTELPPATVASVEPAVAAPPVEESAVAVPQAAQPDRRARRTVRRPRIVTAVPERDAYDNVISQQIADALLAASVPSAEPAAPPPPAPVITQPVRPAVNPSAKVVRGQTVQLGIYLTQRQAEIAWQSAIRDYTFLVTMPKSISTVRLGTRGKRYYRLQLGTPSKRHAKQLCGNLKATGRSCTVA